MALVPDVHALLQWANRSEVAREITRRGYRVSVETLNRWHRERKEVPAVVERIVFDLFGINPDTTKEPPRWAGALAAEVADDVVERLTTRLALPLEPDRLARLVTQLEQAVLPGVEAPNGESQEPRGGAGTPRPPSGSRVSKP